MLIFEENIFDVFLNFFEFDEKNNCNLHPIYLKNDLKCYFLTNCGTIVAQVLLLLMIKGILVLLNRDKKDKGKNGKENWLKKILIYLNNWLNLSFFINLFLAVQIDVTVPIVVNLKSTKFNNLILLLNCLLSLLALLSYIYLMKTTWTKNYYIKKSNQTAKNNEKVKIGEDASLRNWIFLREQIKPKATDLGAYVNEIKNIRDFLISFTISNFINFPTIQILFPLICYLTSLALLIKTMPFTNKFNNMFEIFSSFFSSLIYSIYFLLLLRGSSQTEQRKSKTFGFGLLLTASLAILINIIISITEILSSRCKSKKVNKVQNIKNSKEKIENLDCNQNGLNDVGLKNIQKKNESQQNMTHRDNLVRIG